MSAKSRYVNKNKQNEEVVQLSDDAEEESSENSNKRQKFVLDTTNITDEHEDQRKKSLERSSNRKKRSISKSHQEFSSEDSGEDREGYYNENNLDSPQESTFHENNEETSEKIIANKCKMTYIQRTANDRIKIEKVVRSFINIFEQNPTLWDEFKEVFESTSYSKPKPYDNNYKPSLISQVINLFIFKLFIIFIKIVNFLIAL